MELPPIEYLAKLIDLFKSSKLESLSVESIHLKAGKTVEKKHTKQKSPDVDPSEDEVMSFSLEEPLPHKTALQQALAGLSEPVITKQVRKVE